MTLQVTSWIKETDENDDGELSYEVIFNCIHSSGATLCSWDANKLMLCI